MKEVNLDDIDIDYDFMDGHPYTELFLTRASFTQEILDDFLIQRLKWSLTALGISFLFLVLDHIYILPMWGHVVGLVLVAGAAIKSFLANKQVRYGEGVLYGQQTMMSQIMADIIVESDGGVQKARLEGNCDCSKCKAAKAGAKKKKGRPVKNKKK